MGPLIVKCIERLLTKLDKEKEIEINFPQLIFNLFLNQF